MRGWAPTRPSPRSQLLLLGGGFITGRWVGHPELWAFHCLRLASTLGIWWPPSADAERQGADGQGPGRREGEGLDPDATSAKEGQALARGSLAEPHSSTLSPLENVGHTLSRASAHVSSSRGAGHLSMPVLGNVAGASSGGGCHGCQA